jgi:hypothetical protein
MFQELPSPSAKLQLVKGRGMHVDVRVRRIPGEGGFTEWMGVE